MYLIPNDCKQKILWMRLLQNLLITDKIKVFWNVYTIQLRKNTKFESAASPFLSNTLKTWNQKQHSTRYQGNLLDLLFLRNI